MGGASAARAEASKEAPKEEGFAAAAAAGDGNSLGDAAAAFVPRSTASSLPGVRANPPSSNELARSPPPRFKRMGVGVTASAAAAARDSATSAPSGAVCHRTASTPRHLARPLARPLAPQERQDS